MIKLKSIRIEGMHNIVDKTYDLSDFNYFYGNNGAGKSTILQAVQLALLGYIPGTSKTNSAIFKHSNGPRMSVTLFYDCDDVVTRINRTYTVTGTGKTVKYSEDIPSGFDIEKITDGLGLPIFDFNEFMNLTANKLKDWFINFLPNSDTDICIEKEVREIARDIVKIDEDFLNDIISYVNDAVSKFDNPLDATRQINEHIKSLLSFKKSELQRSESTIQTLTFYEDVQLSALDEVELRNLLSKVNNDITSYNNMMHTLNDKNRLLTELKLILDNLGEISDSYDTDTRVVSHNAERDSINTEIEALKVRINDLTSEQNDIKTQIAVKSAEIAQKQSIIDKGGICPYTSSKCDSIVSLTEDLKLEIAQTEEELKKLNDRISVITTFINEATADINMKLSQSHKLEVDNSAIYESYMRYNDVKSRLDSIIVPDNITVDVINSELEVLGDKRCYIEDKLIKIEANKKYVELYESLASDKMKINENIILCKELQKLTDVNGLQSKIMNAPFVDLSNKVSNYLQCFWHTDVQAEFVINGGANNFSFGIIRNGEYISFDTLSSGEKCIYTLALIISLIYSTNSELNLILIDDLFDHLDDVNYDYLLNELNKINEIQFILAGVSAPNCKVGNIHRVESTGI